MPHFSLWYRASNFTDEGVGEVVEVNAVLWAKRSRSTVCSGAGGGDVLRAKRSRSRAKWSRRRRAPGAKRSRARSVGGSVLRALAVSMT
jgi:hypothetical protein